MLVPGCGNYFEVGFFEVMNTEKGRLGGWMWEESPSGGKEGGIF